MAVDKEWVEGIRKGWKKVIQPLVRVSEKHEGLDSVEALDNALRYLALLKQHLFFGKGLYPFQGGPQTLQERLKDKAPFNIKAKVTEHLEAAEDALEMGKRNVQYWRAVTNPNTTEYKLDNRLRVEQILQDDRFKGKSKGQAVAKFLNFQCPLLAKEAAIKADAEISGKLLRALSSFAGKYPGMHIGLEADREFSIGSMKVVFEDIPLKNLRGLSEKEVEQIRSPLLAKRYVKPMANAKTMLDKKKLGFLWYGLTRIKCETCGGKNPLDTPEKVWGVGGDYSPSKDSINVYVDPKSFITELMIHEVGHRYYYKFMSMADRAEFSSYFGQVPGVSDYGKTISAEDFAEVFAWYCLDRKLTRDQLERFKKFLGRKQQRGASTKERPPGLIQKMKDWYKTYTEMADELEQQKPVEETKDWYKEWFDEATWTRNGGLVMIVRGRAALNVKGVDPKKAREYALKEFKSKDKGLYAVLPEFDVGYLVLQRKLQKALDIPRVQMPVIRQKDIPGFFKYLRDKGIRAVPTRRPVSRLLPTQSQVWLDKLLRGIIQDGPLTEGDPRMDMTIIVSKEGYILDGHHRWGSALITDPSLTIKALWVPLGIKELLPIARAYGASVGNVPRAEVQAGAISAQG